MDAQNENTCRKQQVFFESLLAFLRRFAYYIGRSFIGGGIMPLSDAEEFVRTILHQGEQGRGS